MPGFTFWRPVAVLGEATRQEVQDRIREGVVAVARYHVTGLGHIHVLGSWSEAQEFLRGLFGDEFARSAPDEECRYRELPKGSEEMRLHGLPVAVH